ncbi:XkdX family protein [Clostridium ihumii]|nr:XkdX family protein [Clostridium ihumii]
MEYSNLAYYKFFYDMGIYDDAMIYKATRNGVLTKEEYKIIVGKDFVQ